MCEDNAINREIARTLLEFNGAEEYMLRMPIMDG